jgi:hypothetical protein
VPRASPGRAEHRSLTLYGYRFGGDFFELVARQPVDLDGAPAIGVAVDVPLPEGFQFEGFFTHQEGRVVGRATTIGPAAVQHVAVDHWLAGALQEFGGGRSGVRDRHVRADALCDRGRSRNSFHAERRGGAKLCLPRRTSVSVLMDGSRRRSSMPTACHRVSGRWLFLALNATVVWQAEFTAGMIVRFP